MQVNIIYNEDARNLTKFIKETCIDVTITSPPYWNTIDYGHPKQIGYGQDYNEFLNDLNDILMQIYTLTKPTGSLWLVTDIIRRREKVYLLPFDLIKKLEQCGWKLKDIIIWNKCRSRPYTSKEKLLRDVFECISFFTKSDRFKYNLDSIREQKFTKWWIRFPERYNLKGKVPTNIWNFEIPTQGSWGAPFLRHFCPFPPAIVKRIIQLTTDPGDLVLDPFSGSGVTCAMAYCLGRNFIGFEIVKDYIRQFWNRVLPALCSEYSLKMSESAKQDINRIILGLKMLKYPKVLASKLKNILCSFALVEDERERIYLLISDSSKKQDMISKVNALKSKPPLSKFGITPEVILMDIDELISQIGPKLSQQKLWFYLRHNVFERSISFQELISKLRDPDWFIQFKSPPIISNIAVYQKEV